MAILKKIYPLALLSVLLTGCYEDFTPDIDSKPVLCINSLITAGEPIEVNVSHTWLYTDMDAPHTRWVDDATVTILANGEPVDAGYLPREGDNIHIIAESPTYGMAEAEVTVPLGVPIGGLEWQAEITDRWGESAPELSSYVYRRFNLRASLTIDDPADRVNYYQFSHSAFRELVDEDADDIIMNSAVDFYPGTFVYEAEPIFTEHIGMLDAIIGSDSYGFTFFTDRRFSGASYTLNLHFDDMAFEMKKFGFSEVMLNLGLVLTLSSVSPSYYNWCNYQWNVENGTIGEFGDMGLSDPAWGYSNVSTGAGVVAAMANSSHIINLREFLENELFGSQELPEKTNYKD